MGVIDGETVRYTSAAVMADDDEWRLFSEVEGENRDQSTEDRVAHCAFGQGLSSQS